MRKSVGLSNGGTGQIDFIKGSVLFAGPAKIKENNTNLFWDNINNRLGIGTNAPSSAVDVNGTVEANQIATTDPHKSPLMLKQPRFPQSSLNHTLASLDSFKAFLGSGM